MLTCGFPSSHPHPHPHPYPPSISSRRPATPWGMQLSASTEELVNSCFMLDSRGLVDVKGKGPMRLYLLRRELHRHSRGQAGEGERCSTPRASSSACSSYGDAGVAREPFSSTRSAMHLLPPPPAVAVVANDDSAAGNLSQLMSPAWQVDFGGDGDTGDAVADVFANGGRAVVGGGGGPVPARQTSSGDSCSSSTSASDPTAALQLQLQLQSSAVVPSGGGSSVAPQTSPTASQRDLHSSGGSGGNAEAAAEGFLSPPQARAVADGKLGSTGRRRSRRRDSGNSRFETPAGEGGAGGGDSSRGDDAGFGVGRGDGGGSQGGSALTTPSPTHPRGAVVGAGQGSVPSGTGAADESATLSPTGRLFRTLLEPVRWVHPIGNEDLMEAVFGADGGESGEDFSPTSQGDDDADRVGGGSGTGGGRGGGSSGNEASPRGLGGDGDPRGSGGSRAGQAAVAPGGVLARRGLDGARGGMLSPLHRTLPSMSAVGMSMRLGRLFQGSPKAGGAPGVDTQPEAGLDGLVRAAADASPSSAQKQSPLMKMLERAHSVGSEAILRVCAGGKERNERILVGTRPGGSAGVRVGGGKGVLGEGGTRLCHARGKPAPAWPRHSLLVPATRTTHLRRVTGPMRLTPNPACFPPFVRCMRACGCPRPPHPTPAPAPAPARRPGPRPNPWCCTRPCSIRLFRLFHHLLLAAHNGGARMRTVRACKPVVAVPEDPVAAAPHEPPGAVPAADSLRQQRAAGAGQQEIHEGFHQLGGRAERGVAAARHRVQHACRLGSGGGAAGVWRPRVCVAVCVGV